MQVSSKTFRDRIVESPSRSCARADCESAQLGRHPARQAAALRGVLEEVGYADALVCGELLLIARLNNSPTHKKRSKAPAKPKAAGLRRGGRSNLYDRATVDRGAGYARVAAG